MKNTFCFILISIFVIGCKHESSFRIITNEKRFILDFFPSIKFSGTFLKSDKIFYFFCDPNTAKKIAFFNDKSELIQITSLNKIIENETNPYVVRDIHVLSKDSILLLKNQQNKLVLLDGKGNLLKDIDLSQFYSNNLDYELSSYFIEEFSNNFYKDGIFLSCRLSPRNFSHDAVIGERERLNQHRIEPLFIQFKDLFNDEELEVKKHLKGFLKGRYSKNYMGELHMSFGKVISDKLLLTSILSDSVFIYNHKKMKITDTVKVKSKYTPIGGEPYFINKENMNNASILNREQTLFNGYIYRILYDKKNGYTFFLVTHKRESKEYDKRDLKPRPFSIIAYDDDFNKVDETILDGERYLVGFCFITKDGILIRKRDNPKHNNKRNEKKVFDFDLLVFDD
ncbi:MAG: hypothetical protein WEA99_13235 [Brumimicrobium sp.]